MLQCSQVAGSPMLRWPVELEGSASRSRAARCCSGRLSQFLYRVECSPMLRWLIELDGDVEGSPMLLWPVELKGRAVRSMVGSRASSRIGSSAVRCCAGSLSWKVEQEGRGQPDAAHSDRAGRSSYKVESSPMLTDQAGR